MWLEAFARVVSWKRVRTSKRMRAAFTKGGITILPSGTQCAIEIHGRKPEKGGMRDFLRVVFFLTLTGGTLPAMAEDSSGYPDPARFEKAIAAFEVEDREAFPAPGGVLCLGSSSMRIWDKTIREDLAPLRLIVRGFGGSTMHDAIHYLDRIVLPYRPRAILLYEGENDIGGKAGATPEVVREKFKTFAAAVHEELPECRIYAISIKPSPKRWELWPKMKRANQLLREACGADARLTFIDVATAMLGEDGRPIEELYQEDALHLTAAGYAIWTQAVRRAMVQVEADRDDPKGSP